MSGNLITVIVPVYKAEKYLRRCLDSICNQTHRNLEVILIDDGSPDNSGRICDEYAEKDNRIRVIHKQNAGVSAARNDGLDVATGDFITFVDSDDYTSKYMYQTLIDVLEIESADIAVCGYMQEKQQGDFYINWKGTESAVLMQPEQIRCLLENKFFTCSVCDKIFRKDLICDVRFDVNTHHYEDYLFLYDVMKKSRKVVFTPEPFYYYCNNLQSVSRSSFNSKTMEIIDVCERVKKDIERSYPELVCCAKNEFVRINIMCSVFAAEANSQDKVAIKRLQRNISNYLLGYLKSRASLGYKAFACLIAISWSLFKKVVH